MFLVKLLLLLCFRLVNINGELSPEELLDLTDSCCSHGETFAMSATSPVCSSAPLPEDLEPEQQQPCREAVQACCNTHLKQKSECTAGLKFAESKRCAAPKTDVGKTCCEECSIGRWTGESQGRESCGDAVVQDVSPSTALRKQAFHTCCLEAANRPVTTTKKAPTTTPKRPTTTPRRPATTTEKKESCKPKNHCQHICNDDYGRISCQCREGYRLQGDKKSCKDINECAEALDDLCTADGTVCHNVPGTFKCVPLRKRDTGHRCPAGFKMDTVLNVCNDINECHLPRPPCPKHLCVNSIGGYQCNGKPGKPIEDDLPATPPASANAVDAERSNLCPTGFRSGEGLQCDIDIDECAEQLDDCNRLSQYCINSHGGFFCQDHVSKRCAPGFKPNVRTGVCEDINECSDESMCRPDELCVNQPGAYDCKPKLSVQPKSQSTSSPSCQEGLRLRPGTSICDDIDECREGNHLCDQFQNCINTHGGHECRCKSGYELDVQSGACVDIDECALKLDDCGQDRYCLNVPGTFTCTTTPPPVPSTTHSPLEYEYYYSDEEEEDEGGGGGGGGVPQKPARQPAVQPPKPTSTSPKPQPRNTIQRTTNSIQPAITQKSPQIKVTSPKTEPPILTTPKPVSTTVKLVPTTVKPSVPSSTVGSTSPKQVPATPKPIPTTPKPILSTPKLIPTTPKLISTTPLPVPTARNIFSIPPKFIPTTLKPFMNTPQQIPTTLNTYQRTFPKPGISRNKNPTLNTVYRNPNRRPSNYPPPTYLPPPEFATTTEPPKSNTNKPERNPYVTFVDIAVPKELEVVEKEKGPNDTINIDADEIPKNKWTNFIGKDPDFGPTLAQCAVGYQRNFEGECVDIDECLLRRHICTHQESCRNLPGGYVCDCLRGYTRDDTGWCVPALRSYFPAPTTPSPPPSLPSPPPSPALLPPPPPAYVPPPAPAITPPQPPTLAPPPAHPTPGAYPYLPQPTPTSWSWAKPEPSSTGFCEIGYEYEARLQKCLDIDECATNRANCASNERCVNLDGGYKCVAAFSRPRVHPPASIPAPYASNLNPQTIPVGAQYGQRGPKFIYPTRTRLADSGALLVACPKGYTLNGDKMCADVDECSANATICGAQLTCENFFGGYTCRCAAGHQLFGRDSCVDIDECAYGTPCPINAECENTPGSYRCSCIDGFRTSSPSSDQICEDVDECSEQKNRCSHDCVNEWGGFRCTCRKGYKLASDNSTCEDVDECLSPHAGPGAVAARGPCAGTCRNTAGGYSCRCPPGYTLAHDNYNCVDKNECESGEASCANDPTSVCVNTRGSYHCHKIDCPTGYKIEGKHRCTRIQRSCLMTDWECLRKPYSYSYNFIMLASRMYIAVEGVDLFTMYSQSRTDVPHFELNLVKTEAPNHVTPAKMECFNPRRSGNSCAVRLLCSLAGPQMAELELTMSVHRMGQYVGSTVARLIIIVSEYEF